MERERGLEPLKTCLEGRYLTFGLLTLKIGSATENRTPII